MRSIAYDYNRVNNLVWDRFSKSQKLIKIISGMCEALKI